MLINPSNIILTLNLTIILILFLSIFFFQKNTNPFFFNNNLFAGTTNNNNFSIISKNSTFFIFILKNLAIISLIPLSVNIIFQSPDVVLILNTWLNNNSFSITLEFHFDLNFNIFLSVALIVSWSILEFSFYYMNNDPTPNNFFRLLIIFLLNMIILTSTNNIFLLFIGWEGVGFLSFLLISWWTTRSNANNSAIQAVIYNRIGDIGILLFFSISLSLFNSWSLSEITPLNSNHSPVFILLLIGVVIAAAGKSAQFGLHPWLPAAMEGPTPVSALLHSSTMVVAGIFLLVRISPIYNNIQTFNTSCLILGSLTALFAATTAISQHDIKKIVAYSTTSQLGLMMVSIGLNQPNIALFHICTHAFLKAMLFLSSGSIIHSLNDEQDLRKMGGLHFLLPNTSACIVLGSLALSGIPFLAGFYSKDLILEIGLTSLSNFSGILLAFVATFLTSVYSVRIILFCFFNPPSFSPLSPTNEENNNLIAALNRLALGTIISGWFFITFVFSTPPITINLFLKNLALISSLLGASFSFSLIMFFSRLNLLNLNNNINNFFSNQWFYQNLSHIIFTNLSFFTSLFLSTRNLDRGWSENLGAQGIASLSSNSSQFYQLSQSGYIKQYLILSFSSFLFISLSSVLLF
uniref:NADH-ubiquinone oxidoreductase chain 5 n=1 Tax=Astropecten polyacanthus TaxID=60560 RepID=Q5KSP7_ASTPO|nr:NADH dehydrogenase subunit 5 [Astropecten polyacanthus]BAD86706.1 NADH dehydrogenase subunit 5 [Astropecten polyacanthus]